MRPAASSGRGEARLSRRALVRGGLAGGAGAAALAGGVAGLGALPPAAGADATGPQSGTAAGSGEALPLAGDLVEAFHGEHQAGITTPPQPHGAFVGLDLAEGAGREQLRRLMRLWTDDLSRIVEGRAPLIDQEPELAERTAGLTVTVGWGPGLLEKAGLVDRAPAWLRPLPAFEVDELEERWAQTDLVLQVCSYSPVTLAHARRQLTIAAEGLAAVRWVQTGYREPMERHGWSMRNLFGQVDGTVQPDVAGRDEALLWIEDGPWAGGSSLVLRRIRMDMHEWDRADRVAREAGIGRDLATGAPITGGDVATPVDLHATLPSGLAVVNPHAHVARAAPVEPHERFLRRPYSYELEREDGATEMGLLFAAYQADPVRQFLPVQRRLDEADLLNLWTTPVGSGVWAVLPGCAEGEFLGQALLA